MKIFTQLNDEYKNLALALGFFDGVHLGHQEVIKSAVDFARQNGTKSAVITFKEHPQVVLRGFTPSYILTAEARREKLAALGVDFVFELDFNELSLLSGEEYIRDILVKNFAPISISTGFNHHFGTQKTGTPELLDECAKTFGYEYFKIAPVVVEDEVVSSSLIRETLAKGDVAKVNALLGYDFSVEGVVQKGAGLASKIGFKTANIAYPRGLVSLPFGVYSVRANGLLAVANYGVKPTFESLTEEPVLEVHILNFDECIYGKKLCVEIVEFIRPERKFASVEELVRQIENDISVLTNPEI